MAQLATDIRAQEFRDNAETIGTPAAVNKVLRRNPDAPNAKNDDNLDDPEYENNPHRDRTVRARRKPTKDQEILAQRSGYVHTDVTTREGAQIAAREATQASVAQRAAVNASTGIFGSLYQSAKSTVTSWYNSASSFMNDTFIEPAAEFLASGRQMWNEHVYNPIAQAASDFKNWGMQKIDQAGTALSNAGTAISNKVTSAKDWAMSWFESDTPAQQPQAAQQQVTADVKPDAASQELSGAKNNPDAGFSLKSTWDSFTSGVSNTFGIGAPAPTHTQHLKR